MGGREGEGKWVGERGRVSGWEGGREEEGERGGGEVEGEEMDGRNR